MDAPIDRVNLDRYRLEEHVTRAIEKAYSLAQGEPLTGGHLLQGALIVAQASKSQAFMKLAELLPVRAVPYARDVERPDLSAIPVSRPLAQSFANAQDFLLDGKAVWGRDYITIALLAREDSSLEELAREARTDIGKVRSSWLDYVRTSEQRRGAGSWEKWWYVAGFTPERAATPEPAATPEATATPQPAESAAQKSGAAVPLDLAKWNLSDGASDILQAAVERIRGAPQNIAVSTTAVLLEMAEMGRPGTDPQWVADFLRHAFAESGPGYEAVIRKYRRRTTRESKGVERKLVMMMPGLAWSLECAQDIARRTTGAPRIAGRHLLAGLIAEPPQPYALGAHQRLAEIGVDVPLLRERLYQWVQGYGDDDTQWREVLVAAGPQPWRRAQFDADRTTGPDLLNIEQDVVALATLIAARDSSPPLSIGLFGDWGSGKTFFMDRLRRTVAHLSDEARKAGAMQRDLPFYKHIVQIEFNAWHYVEGNLWASMVEHILANLRKDDRPTETEVLQKHWIEKLGFAEQAKSAAETNREKARRKVDDAEGAVRETQLAHEEKKKEVEKLCAARAARDFRLSGALPVIRQALAPLGLAPLSDALNDLQSSLREARSTIERGNAVITPLLRAKDRTARLASLIVIVLGASAAAAAVGWIVSRLGSDLVAQISSYATAAAGLVMGAVPWIRKQTAWVSQRVKEIEDGQRVLNEEEARSLAEVAAKTAKAEAELQLARQEYLLAQQKAEQARKDQAAAAADLAAATTASLLGRFVQDRAASDDYRKHLGVLALVRRDFEQLSRLIEEDNWKLSPSDADKERYGKLEKIASLELEARDDSTRINRIVLYIDDLDRCPPKTVVSVLQAVHLLLAFPLFVVVVGVDARWVARSLETRYRELLHVDSVDPADEVDELFGVARSQDYLEKIFQIPLWLKPMNAGGARRMVNGLLRKALPAVSRVPIQATAVSGQAPAHSAQPAPVNGPANPAEGVPTVAVSAEPAPAGASASAPAPAAEALKKPERVVPNIESLDIKDFELNAIDGLSPLLGRSPRALKRFVNLYRLMKAGLSQQRLKAFLRHGDEKTADFDAVLFLLAVDTGLPRISRALFDAIQTLSQSRDAAIDADALLKELDGRVTERSADQARFEAWMRPRSKLIEPETLKKMASWISDVSRYSFQAAPFDSGRKTSPGRKAKKDA
jgi:hypothetical protein